MGYRVGVVLAALVVLAAGRPAAAETVRGYVYVTAARGVRTTYKSQASTCRVTVRIPAAPVARRPANDDRGLLANATSIAVTVSDPFDNCTHFIHTWQPATFDPAHRDHVEIGWPAGRPSIFLILIVVALMIITGWYAIGRVRERRARTRRTVRRA